MRRGFVGGTTAPCGTARAGKPPAESPRASAWATSAGAFSHTNQRARAAKRSAAGRGKPASCSKISASKSGGGNSPPWSSSTAQVVMKCSRSRAAPFLLAWFFRRRPDQQNAVVLAEDGQAAAVGSDGQGPQGLGVGGNIDE